MTIMKSHILFFSWVHILFYGCSEKVPTQKDICGKWYGSDSTVCLVLKTDGYFTANNLPTFLLPSYVKKEYGDKFSSEGKWTLSEQGRWQIKLISNDMSFYIPLSREGQFEEGTRWYLFLWVNQEEGGERYRFKKISR